MIKELLHNKMNIKELIKLSKVQSLTYTFFYGSHKEYKTINESCFSQFYPITFNVNNVTYNSTEQYMMASKAKLFNDITIYDKILLETKAANIKKLGRQIKNFNDKIWNEKKCDIVYTGNLAKFSQNNDLKNYLLLTKHAVLVEAAPYDKIWGIGMSKLEKGIEDPINWKGENLLGFTLMQVRSLLQYNCTKYRLYPNGTIITQDEFEDYDNGVPYYDDFREVEIPDEIIEFIESNV